ncbi:MAG: acyl-[Lachnospiraceae bacterium]|nr:acyl-[acyl-carrier-protein] thioesterase [Lachnospiraceae bacterium]
MYQYYSKVRFSETDEKRKLTLEAIVDYFQDCSTFQTEELGVGFSYLLPKNLTWILLYWHIVVEEYPSLGEKITISTIPYDFKGFLGKRNFFMEKEDGRIIAKADSLWSLLDMKKMIPTKVPEEVVQAYPKEDKIDMEYLPRKITIAGEERREEPLMIQRHHLDCNNHVNNGQYIKIAGAYLPDGFEIKQMRAEYRKQAYLGNEVFPYIYENEDKITVSLCDSGKQPYVVVEFQSRG